MFKKIFFALIALATINMPLLHPQLRRGFTQPNDTDFVITNIVNTSRSLAYIFPLTKKTYGHSIGSGETLKPAREQSAESTESSLPGIENRDSLIIISLTKQFLLIRDGDSLFISDITGFEKLPNDYKMSNFVEQKGIRNMKNIIIIINSDGTLKFE